MVNTFMPCSDYEGIASILDYRRLGKQRVEAKQIINVPEKLEEDSNQKIGWKNHPAVKMWKGYIPSLKKYYNAMVKEWIYRGYNNTMQLYPKSELKGPDPWWINSEVVVKSHQASLIRKDYDYYAEMFPDLEDIYLEYSYVWPNKYNQKILENALIDEVADIIS